MTNHSDEYPQAFDSSRIDEELEALTSTNQTGRDWDRSQASKKKLLNDLGQVYAISAGQQENDLEEVWRRVASSTSYARSLRDQSSMRKEANMRQETFIDNNNTFVSPNKNKQPVHLRRRQRLLAILGPLAAILVVVVLVGSTALIFNMASKNNMAHKPTSTPVVNSSGIYVSYQSKQGTSIIGKVDAKTHKLLWTYQREDFPILGVPTVYGDMVYLNAFNSVSRQPHLVAMNATTGKERWDIPMSIQLEGRLNLSTLSSPVGSDGQIFVINRGGTVFAFNSETGKQNWSYATGASAYVQPHITDITGKERSIGPLEASMANAPQVSNGILYGAQHNIVYALDTKSGHVIWQYKITSEDQVIRNAQVVDGVVYATSSTINYTNNEQPVPMYHGYIYALNKKNGSTNWNYELKDYDLLPPAIDSGHIYFIKYNSLHQNTLGALDVQGHKLWEHDCGDTSIYWLTAGDGYVSISGIAHDQSNVTSNQSGLLSNTLYVLDANGHLVWQKNSAADDISIKNGLLYTENGLWIIAYDIKTRQELWRGQYSIEILDRAGNNTALLGIINIVP